MFRRIIRLLHCRRQPGRTLPGLAILFLVILTAGCGPRLFPGQMEQPGGSESFEVRATKTDEPVHQSSTPAEPVPEAATTTPEPTGVKPSATPVPDPVRTRYLLSAFLDYDLHHVEVYEALSYVNTAGTPLDQLVLVLEPEYRATDFLLDSLTWLDGANVETYTLDGGLLRVDLDRMLEPGKALELKMAFKYTLPDHPGSLGYSSRQANLADWYAMAPPYVQGQGWMVSAPGEVGEHITYDMADYEVEIQPVGKVNNVVVAASAPARKVGNIYHFQRENARNFSFSISPDYQVVYDAYGAAPITGYVFPEHIQAGMRAASYVREALEVFSELFGSYDLPSMTLVEAEFPDGLEYDGLFFLSQSFFANYNDSAQSMLCFLSVHETAHQWWYRVAANDQAMQPWLDEAFSTYSEVLFYEQRYPQLVPWWWDFRINSYKPQGWVNSTIYDFHDDRPYINAVYLRGARFLDGLRTRMGAEAFQQFLLEYAAHNANRITDEETFFQLLGEHYPGDLSDLVKQFFDE